jgi:hypothetical protein
MLAAVSSPCVRADAQPRFTRAQKLDAVSVSDAAGTSIREKPTPKPEKSVKERDVVSYSKQIDTSRLDSNLPSQTLERWLSSKDLRLDHVAWSWGDCDLKTEPRNKGVPIVHAYRF